MLEKWPDVTLCVYPGLRAQIFVPLYHEIGHELFARLKEVISKSLPPPEENYLPLCITMWFLILTYQHCHTQAEKAVFLFTLSGGKNFPNIPSQTA